MRLLDARELEDLNQRFPGRPGAPLLRSVLDDYDPDGGLPRSRLEERFLMLCRTAALPKPRANARIALADGPVEVDFLWPRERLVAELDGYRFHGTRSGFEQDRARDRRLLIAGYRVVRFTWRQLTDGPDEVIATIRALLHPAPQPT